MDLSIYALDRNDGTAIWFLDQLAIVKASAKHTGNAFGLIEILAPVGSGSPYHVHRAEDESFYIFAGQLEFISGEQRFCEGPGGFVFLPRDIPHGFRVVGQSPAKFLVLTTPGGFEGFVMDAGEPATTLTLPVPAAPDMNKLIVLAAKYRVEILGPLPD